MAQKLKKKTVKESTEDLLIMENKFEQFEKTVNYLTAKVDSFEKQIKEDNTDKDLRGPENENN